MIIWELIMWVNYLKYSFELVFLHTINYQNSLSNCMKNKILKHNFLN